MTPGLKAAIKAAGNRYQLGKKLGLSVLAVYKWHEIPIRRVLEVERVTGVDRSVLRPDLFRRSA